MRSFVELLKISLRRQGLTQAEFARRVKVSPATISNLIGGRHNPAANRGEKWADVLGLAGDFREEFLDSMAVSAASPRVAALVARLEKRAR